MNTFHLDIVTIYGSYYSDEVESLLVHTDDGDVEILAGHADFLASVATGRARIIKDGKSRLASCSGGFLSVNNKQVKLVTSTFEFADEIDVNRALAAKEKAEKRIERAASDKEIALAKAKLQRAVNRISIAETLK